MELKITVNERQGACKSAFTVAEAVVAMGVVGVLVVALYAGMTSATLAIRLARENHRATQIMVEKMELIRLYTWDQVNSNGYMPTNFTAPYYDNGTTNYAGSGLVYTGTLSIALFPATPNYSNDMKVITMNLTWTSGGLLRKRQLSTLVGRYGLQNYVIN